MRTYVTQRQRKLDILLVSLQHTALFNVRIYCNIFLFIYNVLDITMLEDCHNFQPQRILHQQNDTGSVSKSKYHKAKLKDIVNPQIILGIYS